MRMGQRPLAGSGAEPRPCLLRSRSGVVAGVVSGRYGGCFVK